MDSKAQVLVAIKNTADVADVWQPPWLKSADNSTAIETPPEPETHENPDENDPCNLDTRYPGTDEFDRLPQNGIADIDADACPDVTFPRFPDELNSDNEFYWSQLSDDDREYLTWHRDYPAACAWCGGRTRHNPLCDELRASWQLTMPFGKFKGKPFSEVPRDYLAWLTANSTNLDTQLRDAILLRIKETQ